MLKFVFLVKNILAAFKKRFTSVQDSQFISPNDNASHDTTDSNYHDHFEVVWIKLFIKLQSLRITLKSACCFAIASK